MKHFPHSIVALFLLLQLDPAAAQDTLRTQVLVVGGGTGGTAAAITAARLGAHTILTEEGPWLGGMLSSAGVSATDGNDQLPSGIWQKFREALYQAYQGKDKLSTGWVSNTAFEPHVADSIFKAWAAREKNLTVRFHLMPSRVIKRESQILGVVFRETKTNRSLVILATQTIEATEQGDLLELAGIPYDLGMEAGSTTGEKAGVKETNDIVQDLTWVAILKDMHDGRDHTIPRPPDYDPHAFDGSCTDYYHDSTIKRPTNSAKAMLEYGRLPQDKYMLNWPIRGNDTYLNVVRLAPENRGVALQAARATTLRFVYFIQHELRHQELALAKDEFPSGDGMALIPYFRESRRVRGTVRFTMPDVATPFAAADPLYRTGIAVGDYPIDHHHKKNPKAPQHLDFYPVPSFSLPLGCLIPDSVGGLIVADKNISVSNVVNGTTRLQPVVLLTGQAAGTLAAIAVRTHHQASQVNIRDLQDDLLRQKAYLLPYLDVQPDHPYFSAIQKVGATGLLRGTGVPHQWANETWFYPDALANADTLYLNWQEWVKIPAFVGKTVTLRALAAPLAATARLFQSKMHGKAIPITETNMRKWLDRNKTGWLPHIKSIDEPLTRGELAFVLDRSIDVFHLAEIDLRGHFVLPSGGAH